MEASKKDQGKKALKIDIFRAWCKGCGICAAFCPKNALAIDEAGYPYVKDAEACARCGLCELRCPDFAITVEQKKTDKESAKTHEEAKPRRGAAPGE